MLNNNTDKNKLIGVSAIMSDPKLSKIVEEGLNSPPGSSKRQKAASVLRTFDKKKKMDGMGGNGMEGSDLNLMSNYTPPMGTAQSTPAMLPLEKPKPTPEITQPVEEERDVVIGEMGPSGKVIFPSAPEVKTTPTVVEDMAEVEKLDFPELTEDYYTQWYEGLAPDEQDKWKPLYEAVSAGVGPSTFAWSMMEDTEKMKKILPGVPEEALPQGASLARQVGDLEDSLRDEFKLDQLASNLTRLQERGLTVTDDLKGYVTARDKYIEKLDNMIDSSRVAMGDMDMANPYVSQRMGNYMNYLYVMKGRQQKRYIDMVNTAIGYHNQELTRADNAYKTAYNQFTNELKGKTEITKEEYNRFKGMLEEMYNNVAGKEKTELEMQKLRESVAQAQYQTAIDAAESVTALLPTTGWTGLTDAQKAQSESKYIEASDKSADEAAKEFANLSGAEKLKWYSAKKTTGETSQFYALEILKGLQYAQSGGDKGSPSIYYDIDEDTGKGKIRWDKLTGASKTEVQKAMAAIIADQAKTEETKQDIKSNPLKWIRHFFGKEE